MDQVTSQGQGILQHDELNSMETMEEFLLCGLRKVKGISSQEFAGQWNGLHIEDLFDRKTLHKLIHEDGLLVDPTAGMRTTHKGFQLLDSVLVSLLSGIKPGVLGQ